MITLTQLYKLGLSENIDIFDGLKLPRNSPLDRDTIVNVIMEKCGLNIPMYADAEVMHSAITLWSVKNQYTFDHVGKIFIAEYSPIENTDRYDSITVDHGRDLTDNTKTHNGSKEDGSTTSNNTNMHTGTDTTNVEETTSADNADDYQPKDQTDSTNTYNSTITDNGGGTMNKNITADGTVDKTIGEKEKTTTIQHLHGNIGTTTNTMLQSEEYELLAKYNPYNFIAGLFENELTLFIY